MMNTINKKKSFWITPCFFMMSCAMAKTTTFNCPDKIQFNNGNVIIDEPIKDWQSTVTQAPLWLTNVGVYDGPVKDNAAMQPVEEKGKNSKWIFEGDYPQEKFAACEYGNGVVKLYKKIENSAKNCSSMVKTSVNRSGIEAVIVCGP